MDINTVIIYLLGELSTISIIINIILLSMYRNKSKSYEELDREYNHLGEKAEKMTEIIRSTKGYSGKSKGEQCKIGFAVEEVTY